MILSKLAKTLVNGALRKFSSLVELEEGLNRVVGTTRSQARQTYVHLLRKCGSPASLINLRTVHHHIVRNNFCIDRFMSNVLVEMYSKCGSLAEARAVFESIHEAPNVYSWTLLIAAYFQNGFPALALELFNRMELEGVKPSAATLVVVAGVFAQLREINRGRQLLARIEAQGPLAWDAVLVTALFNMFAKLGCLTEARSLFEGLKHMKDTVSWTAMIAAYAQADECDEASSLYRKMNLEGVPPGDVTFLVAIGSCCSSVEFLRTVEDQVGERGRGSDSVIGSALVSAYGKQGRVGEARRAFERIGRKGLSAWNAMMVIYAKNGLDKDAVDLYKVMKEAAAGGGDEITFSNAAGGGDEITFSNALSASKESFEDGSVIFRDAVASGFHLHSQVRSAAINFFSRFGDLKSSRMVFEMAINCRSLSCWNALIGAFAQHGEAEAVLEFWFGMQLEGVDPDETTLVSVLFVCSHCGMVEEGIECFVWSRSDYGIGESAVSYRCLVDLLGRSGEIEQAAGLVRSSGFPAGELESNMLRAACKNQQALSSTMHVHHQDPHTDFERSETSKGQS